MITNLFSCELGDLIQVPLLTAPMSFPSLTECYWRTVQCAVQDLTLY